MSVDTVKSILAIAEIIFVIYLMGYSTFLFVSVVYSGNELFESIRKKQLRNEIHHDYYVPVSIIVPAYNEEVTILETITSLLQLEYHTFEIIVVNDGSQDETAARTIAHFGLKQVQRPIRRQIACQQVESVYETKVGNVSLTLVNKLNGGKADSINMGINVSQYPYFVCMDADSILEKESLQRIVVPILESQNVIAVGSMIRISNDSVFKDGKLVEQRLPKKLIPALQVLEYERSFLASRILLDRWNANLIISGAFGLFQKEAVLQVGGYERNSMGEDMELVVKLHSFYRSNRLPYQIRYAYDAVCWTQAPERLHDLLKQRKRWHIGLFQSLLAHRNLMFTGSYLYYLIYELLSPFIELFGMCVTVLGYLYGLLNVQYMVIFFLTYAVFGSVLTCISFMARNYLSEHKLRFRDVLRAILFCIPENIGLRFVMAWTRIFALLFYRGSKTKWGRIQRVKIHYTEE